MSTAAQPNTKPPGLTVLVTFPDGSKHYVHTRYTSPIKAIRETKRYFFDEQVPVESVTIAE